MAERCTRTIAGIGQHGAEPDPRSPQAIQFGQGNLALAARCPVHFGHAGPGTARSITHPLVGQEQPQSHRDRNLALRQAERDQRLAVRPLPQLATVLPCNANRQRALLRHGGIINHQIGVRSTNQSVRFVRQHRP